MIQHRTLYTDPSTQVCTSGSRERTAQQPDVVAGCPTSLTSALCQSASFSCFCQSTLADSLVWYSSKLSCCSATTHGTSKHARAAVGATSAAREELSLHLVSVENPNAVVISDVVQSSSFPEMVIASICALIRANNFWNCVSQCTDSDSEVMHLDIISVSERLRPLQALTLRSGWNTTRALRTSAAGVAGRVAMFAASTLGTRQDEYQFPAEETCIFFEHDLEIRIDALKADPNPKIKNLQNTDRDEDGT